MDFAAWILPILDAEHRSSFHEAGHVEYARSINPAAIITATIAGGNGIAKIDLAGFTDAQKYGVAVAGCLAEAKGCADGVIGPGGLNAVAQQISDAFQPGNVGWQVDVPIAGNPEPSSCNGGDFEWLIGVPDINMLNAAVVAVAAYFNNDANWLRVRRRAWSLAMVNRPEV